MYREEHWRDPSRAGITVPIGDLAGLSKGARPDQRITDEMTLEACRKNQGYENPLLNDSLCLNYKGIARIESLGAYRNLHCLYLDCNGITKIEHLDHMTQLKSLYLQSNCITKLENIPASLLVLNLRENRIAKIENLEHCLALSQINLAKNRLMNVESLSGLRTLAAQPGSDLQSIDISANYIDEEDPLVSFFDGEGELSESAEKVFEKLNCVFLQNNPSVRRIKNYRRRLVAQLPNLTFLDTKQVTEVERVSVQGWVNGGADGEQNAKRDFYLREREQKRIDLEKFRRVQELANKKLQKQLKRQAAEQASKEAYQQGSELPSGYVEHDPQLPKMKRASNESWVLVDSGAGAPEAAATHDGGSPRTRGGKKEGNTAGGNYTAGGAATNTTSRPAFSPPSRSNHTNAGVSSSSSGTPSDKTAAVAPDGTHQDDLTLENLDKLPFSKLDPRTLLPAAAAAAGTTSHTGGPSQGTKKASSRGDGSDTEENSEYATAISTSVQPSSEPGMSSEQVALSADSTGFGVDSRAPSEESASEAAPEWYWTKLRDERLERLAARNQYRFKVVAAKLAHEFNSQGLTERMARDRYGQMLRRMPTVQEGREEDEEQDAETNEGAGGQTSTSSASSSSSTDNSGTPDAGTASGGQISSGSSAGADVAEDQDERDRARWWIRRLNEHRSSSTASQSSSAPMQNINERNSGMGVSLLGGSLMSSLPGAASASRLWGGQRQYQPEQADSEIESTVAASEAGDLDGIVLSPRACAQRFESFAARKNFDSATLRIPPKPSINSGAEGNDGPLSSMSAHGYTTKTSLPITDDENSSKKSENLSTLLPEEEANGTLGKTTGEMKIKENRAESPCFSSPEPVMVSENDSEDSGTKLFDPSPETLVMDAYQAGNELEELD
ncbi:unnamed protein product [Amoebophrya sp. A25]|nr:unnamed protein product [Amoebophrya sp. A25]|eukprot:GSA25T00020039001.1